MELGFPWWLRVQHFLTIIFISFLVRSGIEILGTYPQLYRSQHTVAGPAWGQFTIQRAPTAAASRNCTTSSCGNGRTRSITSRRGYITAARMSPVRMWD